MWARSNFSEHNEFIFDVAIVNEVGDEVALVDVLAGLELGNPALAGRRQHLLDFDRGDADRHVLNAHPIAKLGDAIVLVIDLKGHSGRDMVLCR